jgi:hypothetical protein
VPILEGTSTKWLRAVDVSESIWDDSVATASILGLAPHCGTPKKICSKTSYCLSHNPNQTQSKGASSPHIFLKASANVESCGMRALRALCPA